MSSRPWDVRLRKLMWEPVPKTVSVTLVEDPHVEVVVGDANPAQREFRDRWLRN